MAIAPVTSINAWQRIANYARNNKPYVQFVADALKRWLTQQGGNPDLQVVPFGPLSAAETVIADAPCRLYALFLSKQGDGTPTFTKLTNSDTASSDAASQLRFWSNAIGQTDLFVWPHGLEFTGVDSGITMQGNTTADGGTTSGANACLGFAVIGRP